MTNLIDDRSEIVFFDLETTRPDQDRALLEFGAILVCPRTLAVLDLYATLIRPEDPSTINSLRDRPNGISRDSVASAPSFREVADRVYDILHGRVWAGHNILEFDCLMIKEAFEEVGRAAPEPKGAIDSLAILKQKFGRRAGNMKLDSLAPYFGLGEQTHRSLDDVRMNLEVVKRCATVLFLENNVMGATEMLRLFEGCSDGSGFVDPDEVSIPSIYAEPCQFPWGTPRLRILHKNAVLQICCPRLRVRVGLDAKFSDHAGRPRFNFVVDASASLCLVLDACHDAAFNQSKDSGSDSEWRPVVMRNFGYLSSPTVRLDLPAGENATSGAEIYRQDSSGTTQKLTFNASSAGEHELETLLIRGAAVDAYFSLEPYDYMQNAGIKLVVKKLVIHSA
uniref:Exonuclease domain-containing protein n=1 Tax=Kalanchoe fedtschenkoi TaxID=63787 RepID=A0A7N0VM27_KALFE